MTNPYEKNTYFLSSEDMRDALESLGEIAGPSVVTDASMPLLVKKGGDAVNHPDHYRAHPSGIECIEITSHMSFCLGNAMKYLWRADHKGAPVEDLRKAIWYIQKEIDMRLGGLK